MWKAVDGFADFDVDESVFDMLGKFVLACDVVRKNAEGHFHVFISCHGCAQVEIFNVEAHVAGAWRANGAVP